MRGGLCYSDAHGGHSEPAGLIASRLISCLPFGLPSQLLRNHNGALPTMLWRLIVEERRLQGFVNVTAERAEPAMDGVVVPASHGGHIGDEGGDLLLALGGCHVRVSAIVSSHGRWRRDACAPSQARCSRRALRCQESAPSSPPHSSAFLTDPR